MKNKFSLGLSVVALLILLSVVWNINLNRPPREMSLHIQPLAGETRFKLYYDIGKVFGEAYSTVSVAKPGATLVGFDLPAEPLRKIRIDIGYATGTICIESIDFGPQHWSADAILTGFKPIRDINSFSKIGDCACAVAYDNHPELLSQGDFKDVYTAIDAMTGSRSLIVKTLISVLALGIAIGIFLWLQRSAAGKRVESAFARLPYDRVLIAAMFITALWLPLIGNLFGIAPSLPQTENRRLRRAPDLTEIFLSRFPDEFNGYYNDNFGFRNLLIRWNSILRYEGLNVSTRPEVIVGKDHWLFYNADVDRGNGITMRDYQGLEHFTQDQLRRIRTKLEAHRDTLARYGILYLVAVAPNKCSIYDEYMPSAINRIGPTTRQDQLIHRYPRGHLAPMMRGVIERDVAADRASHDYRFFQAERVCERVNKLGVLVDSAMRLPVNRVRAEVARKVQRIGVKAPLRQQGQKVGVFQ